MGSDTEFFVVYVSALGLLNSPESFLQNANCVSLILMLLGLEKASGASAIVIELTSEIRLYPTLCFESGGLLQEFLASDLSQPSSYTNL
jgi:hypothetical protein